jgi:hypothetical protein
MAGRLWRVGFLPMNPAMNECACIVLWKSDLSFCTGMRAKDMSFVLLKS